MELYLHSLTHLNGTVLSAGHVIMARHFVKLTFTLYIEVVLSCLHILQHIFTYNFNFEKLQNILK